MMATPLRVLILEDRPADAELMVLELRRAGYAPDWRRVESETEFLAALDSRPDLILSDYNLPDWDGIHALQRLAEKGLDIPFILVSGTIGEDIAVAAMRAGASDYLIKDRLARLGLAVVNALQRRSARRAKQQVEKQWNLMLDSMPAGTYTCDPEGLITFCNQQAVQIWGRAPKLNDPADRYCGSFKLFALDGSPITHEQCWMGRALRENKPYLGREIVIEQPDGNRRIVLAHANPIQNETGGLIGAVNVLVDITERKRAEQQANRAIEALRESEEHLRDLFENAIDLIHSVGPDGRVLYANRAWRETLGYRDEEVTALSLCDIISPEHIEHCNEMFERLMAGEKIEKFRTSFVSKTGREVLVEGSVNCRFVDGKPVSTRAVFRNITEQVRLEQQLRQVQKMEAVGRLAGGVAHDFNNLLTIMNGYTDLVMEQMPEGSSQREMLEEVKKAGERAADLTHQLLAFSRKQLLAPKVLNLNRLLADMENMLRRLIEEDVDLLIVQASDLWQVLADPGQLQQVVMNLAVNARDAMPEGGNIIIETVNCEVGAEYTEKHPEMTPGDYVQLAVTDTGHGMDRQTMARIFEPFFTTKGPEKGTGLGLAVVYGIIKQSGGFIYIDSEPGVGTTFRIYLPRHKGGETWQKPPSGIIQILPRGTETILLAEDDDSVRGFAARVLRECGYNVLEAHNGKEALQFATAHDGLVHLLVTDVIMPKMSGKQLAESLQASHPNLKVLYVSGYTANVITQHGVLTPDVALLQKPFSAGVLAQKVRKVLDQVRNAPPNTPDAKPS